MNHEPDPRLQRDLFAHAAARVRRKIRRRRYGFTAGATVTILATLGFLISPTNPALDLAEPALPSTPSSPPTAPVRAPGPSYRTLTTDQELLAAVADQGPILVTLPDGRKRLILTRAH